MRSKKLAIFPSKPRFFNSIAHFSRNLIHSRGAGQVGYSTVRLLLSPRGLGPWVRSGSEVSEWGLAAEVGSFEGAAADLTLFAAVEPSVGVAASSACEPGTIWIAGAWAWVVALVHGQ